MRPVGEPGCALFIAAARCPWPARRAPATPARSSVAALPIPWRDVVVVTTVTGWICSTWTTWIRPNPFEVDDQAAHLFKHPYLGLEDVLEVWSSDPLFYPAKPPAHWLMVAEVSGQVLVVPLAPTARADKCRPIGCYAATRALSVTYRKDR